MRMIETVEAHGKMWAVLGSALVCITLGLMLSRSELMTSAPVVGGTAPFSPSIEPVNQARQNLPIAYEYHGTIVQLQQFRQTSAIHISSAEGKTGVMTLVNLNPAVGAWYLLTIAWNGSPEVTYHLQNPAPLYQSLALDERFSSGIVLIQGEGKYSCNLIGSALEQARASQAPFAPLCEARLFLRNPAEGRRTKLEAATEFLRNEVWGGEKVIILFHHLMEDSHRETGHIRIETPASPGSVTKSVTLPISALIDARYTDKSVAASDMGIPLEGPKKDTLQPGSWYAAGENPGIYVSIMEPAFVDSAILQSYKSRVSNLDSTETSSLCYLVAFDLDQFDLSYALGTEYPGVGWSPRTLPQMRDPRLPGPDGIGTIVPLVSTGVISPEDVPKTVATFTGGFKREHGAFKYGELAQKNHGSHYGFIEDGVVFSKLQPGLATIFELNNGQTEMKTWEESDNQLLSQIKFARQNGVSIVEFDETSRSSIPGALVNRWGPGNWSGSEDMKLRSIRAGIGLQRSGNKRFLIYAVFSEATPSAMARIFQAYQCRYAMLLDMNALEHTYLAVYRRSGSQFFIDHLIRGMSQVEISSSGKVIPRFLGYPDNRDFFYLVRRNP